MLSGDNICSVVWTDASGQHLRASCGSSYSIDNGKAHAVAQAWNIPESSTPDPSSYAW